MLETRMSSKYLVNGKWKTKFMYKMHKLTDRENIKNFFKNSF